MLSLRTEIVICLFAVALVGLLAGWMMQRARGARRLHDAVTSWEERYAGLEESARQDAVNLEDKLQSLASELRMLSVENRTLRESSRGEEETLDSARAEAIELNRRQAETQERLQRIIREREREIATLRAGAAVRDIVVPLPDARITPREDIVAAVDGLDETIRIDPAQLPLKRAADAQSPGIGAGSSPVASSRKSDDDRPDAPSSGSRTTAARSADASGTDAGRPDARTPDARTPDARSDIEATFSETLDSTMDVGLLEAEEETVALDEETLALVRGLGDGRK